MPMHMHRHMQKYTKALKVGLHCAWVHVCVRLWTTVRIQTGLHVL
jgi:hypothetical protein